MTAKLIDGIAIGKELRGEIKHGVGILEESGCQPGLAVILVGEDPASQTYVKNKEKSSAEVGMKSELIRLPATVTEQELLAHIDDLNNDNSIHGILVQLPLPKHINEDLVIQAIDPSKDVDGFHPQNVGKMIIGQETFLPCTPHGIMEMLKRSGVEIAGKHAVIIGRSNIVGKPMGQLLLQQDATVTYCHSRTKDLSFIYKASGYPDCCNWPSENDN